MRGARAGRRRRQRAAADQPQGPGPRGAQRTGDRGRGPAGQLRGAAAGFLRSRTARPGGGRGAVGPPGVGGRRGALGGRGRVRCRRRPTAGSAAALAGLLVLWARSLTRLMTAPDGSTLQTSRAAARDRTSTGLARLLPPGRTGTVMERSLRYVWRDPKTKAAWVTSLAIGLIVPVFNAWQGTGSVYLACFAAGMLGIQMYNQFGQDTSAFWMVAMTVSSTRDAYVELRARALALLLITLPYATLVTVLTAAMLGDWPLLPEALGLSFALLGAMLATGAWTSARFPYSIPQEGYKNVAPGQVGLAWVSIVGGMVAAAVLCAPVIALTVWLHAGADGDAGRWLLLPVGTLYGAALTLLGLRLAAPQAARRLPEILAAVSKG
ncbi:integral membrane transport protein [Streptomyces viridosporus ATCC 14672]|uniref:Integral membrane transport protein n=1 Tax=Streptomyces viridosporus (strain ATCC 14672 / DSM 40746 / JCM 4963 / KCTC 9882 / NRRL B-12104 / FH 1290) TaxID=566461 RepID=D5ZUZ4_STRV1|nr:integral membrane transport protein [Streptomyces viridosporus ATCC 14672]